MSETGEMYTVPFGLVVHCHVCGATLEPGTTCYIEHDDASAILCIPCLSKRQNQVKPGPSEYKQAAAWMEYD